MQNPYVKSLFEANDEWTTASFDFHQMAVHSNASTLQFKTKYAVVFKT